MVNIQSTFLTEEEVGEIISIAEGHKANIREIRKAFNVSEDKAHELALKVERGELFYISTGGNYEPHSRFFASRYKIVKKIEKKLSDQELLGYAKAGLLSFKFEILKQKHSIKYQSYMRINNLVREAYYAYYRETDPYRLEAEKEKLIERYKILSGHFNNRIGEDNLDDKFSGEVVQFVMRLINENIANRGIRLEGGNYGVFSFDHYYCCNTAERLDNSEKSIHILKYMQALIDSRISLLENMSVEEYRLYKFSSMHLTDEERLMYDKNIMKFQKRFKK